MNRQKFMMALGLGLVPVLASAKGVLSLVGSSNFNGGDHCDGCELIYEGMPAKLSNTTHLPGWDSGAQKLIVEGIVYHKDKRTVAPNVIVYIYHTDSNGEYSLSPGQAKGKRHGHLRGWVKTDADGKYRFYTTMPAPYPGRDSPAHIHPVIKEPGKGEYYLDEYRFDNDPLLTQELRNKAENRGGSGIVKLGKNIDGVLFCRRNIILGQNIPYYA
jgi:protocatechuate 3,4-dioxygenase beta subunit